MEFERLKVSLTKTFIKSFITVTVIFIVLFIAFLYQVYLAPAKYRILEHKRGITMAMIIGAFMFSYIALVIIIPIIRLHQGIWNNKHLSLSPIKIVDDYIIINDPNNKDRKVYLKDIKKVLADKDDNILKITINTNEIIEVKYIKDVIDVEIYLNSLLDKNIIDIENKDE